MKVPQTKIGSAQVEVLDALEEHLGAKAVGLENIYQYSDYGLQLERALEHLLDTYAIYKLIESTDWEELERRREQERKERMAARSAETRYNVMVGIMSSLVMKLRKALPEASITFSITKGLIGIRVEGNDVIHDDINVEYWPEFSKLFVTAGSPCWFTEDDCTLINGSTPPKDQLKGIAELYKLVKDLEG